MAKDKLIIKGAKVNNLKNISLEIPKDKLVIMTGLSGSGKTSLAFDTIYAEGQRRYVESLSTYARQFLGNTEKPDVESIEGLSPAIAIDQKTTHNNPRSTVGTVTEIYDYLRLLYARIGVAYCPIHNIEITSQTPAQMVTRIHEEEEGSRLSILAPIIRNKKGTHKELLENLSKDGFVRVRIDNDIKLVDEVSMLDKNLRHDIDVVIDRLILKEGIDTRLTDSIETALKLSAGLVVILVGNKEIQFSANHSCPECGFSVEHLEPRLFSFNAPLGACDTCKGIGETQHLDTDLLIPNPTESINDGAIRYFKNTVNTENIEWQVFDKLLSHYNIDKSKPINQLTKKEFDIVINGSKEPITYELSSRGGNHYKKTQFIEGIGKLIERRYEETQSSFYKEWVSGFMSTQTCQSCQGLRLNEKALSVKVGMKSISELTQQSVVEMIDCIHQLELSRTQQEISRLIIKEIIDRLSFLRNVGLEYLTLDRLAGTLSGGEAQRIRLANQIGSQLSGVLYVLDEPSIGLHQKDNQKLINALKEMRDLGNSLIVVEHDEETMMQADWIVDIGPYAGIHGGEVIANGPIDVIMNTPDSITGQYLSGKLKIAVPTLRRKGNGKFIKIKKAAQNNLKNVNVDIPLGKLVVVTGVSGSGKSSLVNDVLANGVMVAFKRAHVKPGKVKAIEGLENIDKLVVIDQQPIGRTPRSNPVTYTGVFDQIRDLFASTIDAKMLGFDKSRFSFNVKGGRCEVCQGDGVKRISMHFLPDIYVECEECHGRRYNDQTLLVTYKEKNIYDVLEMTVEEAVEFFDAMPSISNKLKTLFDVGLGYIKLGQSSTSLSGGEAQRVKLASELQKIATGKTLFILDEPTTGLHSYDVSKLIEVLERIVDNGDTVLVIEHNLDIIKSADHIIDLGPEGGENGGTIIATGTPEKIASVDESYTGFYLKKVL
ncbi:MAG: excinuclease ABC subunit UvrA [Erysipelothrix sp.]|nr:excinuclease ABC subunit UvrA [Erysipelothrix sp.]